MDVDLGVGVNVIIPMAGLGSRFTEYGFTENKYLLPIDKYLTKMIEKAILTLNIKIPLTCFIFILREETGVNSKLRNYLKDICIRHNYDCKILSVPAVTEGPACTAYIAKEFINNDIPLIVSNSDQILDWNFESFYRQCSKYDGCVLTYTPDYELIIGSKDKNSFVRLDENQMPIEFVEKTVISKEALVGVHYYKQGKHFIDACDYLFEHNIRAPNGEFYLSYTYQAMLDIGGYTLGTHRLSENEYFHPVGEPIDYFNYYNKNAPILMCDYETANEFIRAAGLNLSFRLDFRLKNEELVCENELVVTDKLHKGEKIHFKEDTVFLRIIGIDDEIDIDIRNYTRGWLIGDFEPNIKRVSEYEIGLLTHKKNEQWGFHYHRVAIEINVLVSGKMIINNQPIYAGDIFVFEPNVIACPIFSEECKIICIKIPSRPSDKYII